MKVATNPDAARNGQWGIVSFSSRAAHYAASVASKLHPMRDDQRVIAPSLALRRTPGNPARVFKFYSGVASKVILTPPVTLTSQSVP